ncbi:MAG: DNA photolyase [Deltaproteobacteria bacterium]|nr:DNA photolyase [Deltaproteobacteria bacterium]MBW2136109.1 DNA photolyase [Deltaproteobacteria bacterium]
MVGLGKYEKLPVKEILLEENAELSALTAEILNRVKGSSVKVRRIKEDREGRRVKGLDSKTSLYLTPFPGALLKPCPGTKAYICCGYQILHLGTNCPMDCAYCILQAYFDRPRPTVFTNIWERLREVAQILDAQPARVFRLGTGEFMDSLALDPLVGWSRTLMPFVSSRKNTILEFKTKTDRIEGLLSSDSRDRIVVSWSLNSPDIVASEERGTSGLRKRLESARRCQEEGFVVGFHLDPIIRHEDWRDQYARTIEMLDKFVRPDRIIWISMGCLRYVPQLKSIIRKRHPKSGVVDGEFIRGLDGKMRYFRPLRAEMYAHLAGTLGEWSKDLGLYLCMESHEVWLESLGWSPMDSAGLSAYLDERVAKLFG